MIKLENVTKVYKGEVRALSDASVDIQKGEFVFLVGASGSGKSTFLRLLNKEETPERGRIFVAGKDIGTLSSWKVPYLRRNIGCVFQDFKLLPNKTVYENVAFALEVIGRPRHVIETQVPAILELVGLAKKLSNFPNELSGGEQQRVSIARAFVNRPLILLADEPTGNLDPATSVGIMRLLDRINRTGTTVVMATHDRSHRRHDAPARDRARPRLDRPRPEPRRLRVDPWPSSSTTSSARPARTSSATSPSPSRPCSRWRCRSPCSGRRCSSSRAWRTPTTAARAASSSSSS